MMRLGQTDVQTAQEILRVASEPHYRDLFTRHLAKKGLQPKPQTDPLVGALNHGRLMARCVCRGAAALHPGWNFAGCLGCGRSWTSIVLPTAEQLDAIDLVLSVRPSYPERVVPRPFYSWTPGESLADLVRENWRITESRRSRGMEA